MHYFDIDSEESCTTFEISPPIESHRREPNCSKSLLELLKERKDSGKHFFSIEVSPSGHSDHLDFNRFGKNQPLFTSITWLRDSNVKHDCISDAPAIHLAKVLSNCSPILLHVTCYKLTESQLNSILENDIQNVFALKGDAECGKQLWKYAIDLVKAVRAKKANATIGVAGYPETHQLTSNMMDDLKFLKAKLDAGAEFIITNACFSMEHLTRYVDLCRQQNITVPIIVGIYVPTSYDSLIKMSDICKFTIPNDQMEKFRNYQDTSHAFNEFAVENAVNFIKQIFESHLDRVYGIQFFTMNKYELIYQVVEKLRQYTEQ